MSLLKFLEAITGKFSSYRILLRSQPKRPLVFLIFERCGLLCVSSASVGLIFDEILNFNHNILEVWP